MRKKLETYNLQPTTYAPSSPRAGFTIIELLIFIAIFSTMVVAFMYVFTSVSGVQIRQSAQAEVASQSQFLLQTIQYYVERASVVDITGDTATTTLQLRMPTAAEDPTIIRLSGNAVTLQQGGGPVRNLTSNKIIVTNLQFTKRSNPPGHDSVSTQFTLTYNTQNMHQQFVQSLDLAVSRAAAATFDSNLVPSTGATYGLGAAAGDWRSINNTIYFSGSNVGIGASSPSQKLQVSGGDVYVDTSGNGIILKNGASCYRLYITGSGGIATTSVTCT